MIGGGLPARVARSSGLARCEAASDQLGVAASDWHEALGGLVEGDRGEMRAWRLVALLVDWRQWVERLRTEQVVETDDPVERMGPEAAHIAN